MPLQIENNYDQVSLMNLAALREQGYSVVKSPHVGNQHPCNLVCAALGIPLEMVSFTQGVRDKNFHPHVRIQNGQSVSLYDSDTWTQFATTPGGQTATEYHQSAMQQVFSGTEIMTDMERMRLYPALAAAVLQATNIKRNQSVWYRRVSAEGQVTKRSAGQLSQADLESNVFQFSNDLSGWVIPNKVHIIFSMVYQALSSGRDVVYHLSGPQMVHYIDGLREELSLLYDLVRHRIPDLPFTLRLRVVPVATARFVAVAARAEGLGQLRVLHEDRLDDDDAVREFVTTYPEYTTPIESGTALSQYDLKRTRDLKLDMGMMYEPLSEVIRLHQRLSSVAQSLVVQAA